MRRIGFALLGLLVIVGLAFALRNRSPQAVAGDLRPVTEARLRSADSAGGGWISYGRDYGNRRYAPLARITRDNVTRLRAVWHYDPRGSSGRIESTPLVADGMMIYTDRDNLVIALDARTGHRIWHYRPKLGPAALCCGLVNRGVALAGDKVYLATLDARLVALDRRTGTLRWEQPVARPDQGYSFTMAPLAAAGRIIVGASGGEFGIRGFVDAYDPETGARIWRFWTVPSPEEGGWWGRWRTETPHGERLPRDIAREKRDSARFADAWQRGGGPVYSTPAYDPELGLVLFGTGNPSTVNGTTPPGDNLYTTSLVALDAGTGALRWYYQMVPHNQWDYDAAGPAVLFDVTRGDSVIPAVAHAGKTGWVYVLDRRTGAPLYRSDPFIPLENIFPAATLRGVRTSPATRGGSNWPPPAYSPRTGLLYVLGSYIPMLFVIDSAAAKRQPGEETQAYAAFRKIEDDGRFGTVTAIDGNSGRIRGQKKVKDNMMYGGALATAGDLVFFGETDGTLNAVDARTGETLWRQQVGASISAPPIAYELDGEQRLAVSTRDGITVFGLPPER
jgi:PQQ-dependent dehydrogenase (methanol/ethanol family)